MITTDVAMEPEQGRGLPCFAKPEVRARKGRGAHRTRWTRSAALSILAHAGLVGAASLVPDRDPGQEPITLDLVQSDVGPQPVVVPSPVETPTVARAHLTPARVPRRSLPRAVAPRPAATAEPPAAIPSSSALMPPDPAPEAQPSLAPGVAVTAGASAEAGAVGALAAAGGGGRPGPGLGVGSGVASSSRSGGKGGSLRGYLEHVQARVARCQRYPQLAIRLGQAGVVVVLVRVHPDGTFAGAPSIATSSGYDVLDREALRMVAQAVPFPPLPEGAARETDLTVPVRFRLEE